MPFMWRKMGKFEGQRPEWKKAVKGERRYLGNTYHMSIGQGDLLVTPLQASVWTAAFANGGNIVRPHLALQLSNKNETTEKFS